MSFGRTSITRLGTGARKIEVEEWARTFLKNSRGVYDPDQPISLFERHGREERYQRRSLADNEKIQPDLTTLLKNGIDVLGIDRRVLRTRIRRDSCEHG